MRKASISDGTVRDVAACNGKGGIRLNRIIMSDFPEDVQELFKLNPYDSYYRNHLLLETDTDNLKLALDTLMLVDKTNNFEAVRKRVIREEIKKRKSRETNFGQELMDEWDQVTGELREKFRKGAYWI